MNSNWFKILMKMTKVEYGKNLLLKGMPVIFNKGGAKLKIGDNVTVKSSFLSNLVGLYSRTIIVTRAPGAVIEIGDNVGISGATIYARKGTAKRCSWGRQRSHSKQRDTYRKELFPWL